MLANNIDINNIITPQTCITNKHNILFETSDENVTTRKGFTDAEKKAGHEEG